MNRTITCVFLAFVLLLTGCSAPESVSVPLPEPDYWPTSGWKSSTPEAQGMDSELLAQMTEQINTTETSIHSLLVIRNGYVLTEAYFHPYTRDTKMHIQSVTKSVIGMLTGKAIGDGTIESEEEKLVDFYQNRIFANPGGEKNAIRLKHLLSMSSGLDCQEFSGGPRMEQTSGWVQFMLDLPMTDKPGKSFGYCNGNAHLLSSILEKTTGMSAREYANQSLFRPLGIPPVDESDWGGDPQRTTTGGYGLHLRPADLARLAYLYLHNGKWDGQQLLPAQWIADSTTRHIQKEDGSGYGYLWTVYPDDGHYAALGLGGQQVHVYPSRNLIVVVTASLESFAEAPEIEGMLKDFILPAIQADAPLAENAAGDRRLETVLRTVADPVQAVPPLPSIAEEISNSLYTFGENPMGWQTLELFFEPGAPTAGVLLNGAPLVIGMDNIYRLSTSLPGGELLLRGHWEQDHLFILDYPYPLIGSTALGELSESEFHFQFTGDRLDVTVQQLVFGGEAIVFTGSK